MFAFGMCTSVDTVNALAPLLNELYGIEAAKNGVSSPMPSFVLFALTVFVAVASIF